MDENTVVLVHTFKLPDRHYMQTKFVETFYHIIGSALCDILLGGGFWHMTEASDYRRSLGEWVGELEPCWEPHVRDGLASLAADVAFSIIKQHEDELEYILSDTYSVKTMDYRLCGNYVKLRIKTYFPF